MLHGGALHLSKIDTRWACYRLYMHVRNGTVPVDVAGLPRVSYQDVSRG